MIRIILIILAVGLAIRGELHHFVTDFRLFTFCAFALAALLATTLARGRLRDIGLVVTALLIGLSVVEATAVYLERRPIVTMTEGWSVARPVLGWGPAHPGVFHAKRQMPDGSLIYETDYTIDDDLLRHTNSATTGPAMVFFGDSYTFGDGVHDSETLPQQFADLIHKQERVLNLGFTGYGPQQFLRGVEIGFYDKIIGDKPQLFLFLTAPWHAQRTSCKVSWSPHSPHYRLTEDGVAFDGSCNQGASLLWHEFLYNSAAYRVFISQLIEKPSHDDVELYIRVLSEAVRQSKAKYGVDTAILYMRVPDAYLAGTGFTNDDIIKRFEASGAKVIDASLDRARADGLILEIPNDGHPTPLANRFRAGLLIEALGIHVTERTQ